MRAIPFLAVLFAITALVLFGLTGMNLLSGSFEGRTCQTDCVRMYFFGSVFTSVLALIAGIYAWIQGSKVLGGISVLVALGLMAVFTVLYVAGNFM